MVIADCFYTMYCVHTKNYRKYLMKKVSNDFKKKKKPIYKEGLAFFQMSIYIFFQFKESVSMEEDLPLREGRSARRL